MPNLRTAAIVRRTVASLLLLGVGVRVAPAGEPSVRHGVGEAAVATKNHVKHTAHVTSRGIKRGARATGRGIKRGAKAVSRGTGHALRKTGETLEDAGQ